jgi:hypothetical protein
MGATLDGEVDTLPRRSSILRTLSLAAALAACSSSTGAEPGGPGPPAAAATSSMEPPAVATGVTGEAPAPASPSPDAERAVERTRFAGRVSAIPPALAREMTGTTWREGCPVPLADLALLRFNYWGLDGEIKRGPMVVNAAVAEDVLWVFGRLFDARFPLKRVGLAREFREARWEAHPNSRRSVTASFNCRVVITPAGPQDEFSQHAYGLAVDVNPLQNPYVREDGWVRNRFAEPYVDRSGELPGMIHGGDVVVRSFAAIGWAWGGTWSGGKDYMHFSYAGR